MGGPSKGPRHSWQEMANGTKCIKCGVKTSQKDRPNKKDPSVMKTATIFTSKDGTKSEKMPLCVEVASE